VNSSEIGYAAGAITVVLVVLGYLLAFLFRALGRLLGVPDERTCQPDIDQLEVKDAHEATFCASCGAPLAENARFCQTCGGPVAEAQTEAMDSGA